ncbi:MAG: DUF2283 domain-containing protein [Planctomycetes bacterium]|nr:DUF2283 domain-containing protein [Planctomycetota bacterium]
MAKIALPEPQFEYDEKADVLYITFGLGEPSYAEQVDDSLLAEYGLFTDQLTGFRIIAPRAAKVPEVLHEIEAVIGKARRKGRIPRVAGLDPNADFAGSASSRLRELVPS